MLKHLSIVALALGAMPSFADAQQRVPVDQYGRPMGQAMPAQPPMQNQGVPMMNNAASSQAMAPADTGGTMRDEYGNLYNGRGDHVDRSGRALPPPVTPPGARTLQ